MECPRKDSWSWLPFPAPEDLPDPGTEPSSLVSPALAGRFFTTVPSRKPKCQFYWMPKPEMSICLRGSESSAFRTVNLEFHRKMLLLIKANLESGPSVPNANPQNARAEEGQGASKVVSGWCQVQVATRDSVCHDPSLQDIWLRAFCDFYIKFKKTPAI